MTKSCKTLKHNVLGRYCWDCKKKTQAGVPGWTRPMRGGGAGYGLWDSNETGGYTNTVTWKNGDRETRRNLNAGCFVCGKKCAYPVSQNVTNNYDGYWSINKANLC